MIAGLGNPGKNYANTRHNVGFMAINRLQKEFNAENEKRKFTSKIAEAQIDNQKVLLVKPMSFMNNSGSPIKEIMDFYRLPAENLLVIYDDMDLPLGSIRIRPEGSAGGHKGLADIINKLGTDKIPRIRIGIGRPKEGEDPTEYVLGRFTDEEQLIIRQLLDKLKEIIICIIKEGYPKAMSIFNKEYLTK